MKTRGFWQTPRARLLRLGTAPQCRAAPNGYVPGSDQRIIAISRGLPDCRVRRTASCLKSFFSAAKPNLHCDCRGGLSPLLFL